MGKGMAREETITREKQSQKQNNHKRKTITREKQLQKTEKGDL